MGSRFTRLPMRELRNLRKVVRWLAPLLLWGLAHAQVRQGGHPSSADPNPWFRTDRDEAENYVDQQAEEELRTGTGLTRRGEVNQAIPHLLAAGGPAVSDYPAEFNLSLC